MSLFGKKNKTCPCGGHCDVTTAEKENQLQSASVKILGSGCAKCNQLEANTLEALKQLGMDTILDHVKEFSEIASYGVMTTPALVYNGKVLAYGKVLKTDEIVTLIQKELQ